MCFKEFYIFDTNMLFAKRESIVWVLQICSYFQEYIIHRST